MNLSSTVYYSQTHIRATCAPGRCIQRDNHAKRLLSYRYKRSWLPKYVQCTDSKETARHGIPYRKQRIAELSGSKNGLDRSLQQKKDIARIADELGEENCVEQLDLTGSKWKLVFTESTASSSGKVGPFVGRTEQEFPADKPGQYINWLYLWPVKASLLANYKQTTMKRIDVSFVELEVQAGPFKWKKELNYNGTWDAVYIDNDLRIIKANNKNLFVLNRMS